MRKLERTFDRDELFKRSNEYTILRDTWMRLHPRRESHPLKPRKFECLAPPGYKYRCEHPDREGRCTYSGRCNYKGKKI